MISMFRCLGLVASFLGAMGLYGQAPSKPVVPSSPDSRLERVVSAVQTPRVPLPGEVIALEPGVDVLQNPDPAKVLPLSEYLARSVRPLSTVSTAAAQAVPSINDGGLVDGASFKPMVAAGSIASLFGYRVLVFVVWEERVRCYRCAVADEFVRDAGVDERGGCAVVLS